MQNLTKFNLNFSYNRIGNEGATKLSEGLSNLLNMINLNLNFKSNSIGIDGAANLSE